MASYTVSLTPALRNQVSEGSLDTSVKDGLSTQRTKEAVYVVNGGNRKLLYRLADGSSYDDTTFVTPPASSIAIGNPIFNEGTPKISGDNVTSGHPTASSGSGSTL